MGGGYIDSTLTGSDAERVRNAQYANKGDLLPEYRIECN